MANALFDSVARFYDYEVRDFVDGLDDIAFYCEYAEQCKGQILELACGTGRVLVPLAQKGFTITGLDASREMLKIAQKKIDGLETHIRKLIHLVHGDMKRFSLQGRFSLIFVTFRSFQHLLTKEEQGACLQCVHKHLENQGVFIVHLFAPRHDLLAQVKRSLDLGTFYDREHDVHVARRAEDHYDLAHQTLREDRFYEWIDKHGNIRRHTWTFDLAYLFRYEAELLLEKYGFKVVDVFGDFKKSPYDYYSGEQIFVTQKV